MRFRSPLLASFILFLSISGSAQQNVPRPGVEPAVYDLAGDISRIAAGVQAMTQTLRDFVDKFAKVDGISLSEKQQRLVTGMQLLVQAEQRLATLQKFQIELAEKEGTFRSRLAQIDIELNPQEIDRSVAFEGSTQTPEKKETRRRALTAERASLQVVLQQVQYNLQDTTSSVREAQSLVVRLRRSFLPMVERELADQ